jgi:DNA-binding transcriptional regulator LsrR (DeoR family)
MRFFDVTGNSLEDEINEHIIGLQLEQYRSIRRVICVAGGEEKIIAIQTALRARLVNVLITDEETARKLL